MKEKKRKGKRNPLMTTSFCYCSPGCLGRAPDSTRGVRVCGPGPSSARQTAPRVTRASGRTLLPDAVSTRVARKLPSEPGRGHRNDAPPQPSSPPLVKARTAWRPLTRAASPLAAHASSEAALLTLSTVDIFGWMFLGCGDCCAL